MPSFMMRVEALERRVAAVEEAIGIKAEEPVKKPELLAPEPEQAPVQAAEVPPAPRPSRPRPMRPRRSLEVDVGRWLLSRAGALALVVAAWADLLPEVRAGIAAAVQVATGATGDDA